MNVAAGAGESKLVVTAWTPVRKSGPPFRRSCPLMCMESVSDLDVAAVSRAEGAAEIMAALRRLTDWASMSMRPALPEPDHAAKCGAH